MTDEKKIEEIILAILEDLPEATTNTSPFHKTKGRVAQELRVLIATAKKEVAKEILDELETLYGNWMLQKETGWNKLTVSVAIKELRKKWGIE